MLSNSHFWSPPPTNVKSPPPLNFLKSPPTGGDSLPPPPHAKWETLNTEPVCKTMFMNTLSTSERFVIGALKCDSVNNVATAVHGLSGKKGNRSLNDEQKQMIYNHIKSFPVMESHYLRAQTKRTYLASDLNMTKMYDLFVEKHKGTKNLPALSSYRKIFVDNFNIGFHKPKKDQCSLCEAYKIAGPELKQDKQEEYNIHISNKEIARSLKETRKLAANDNPDQKVLCFDLQKVLPTPYGENGALYYFSKFSVYNFTCFDLIFKQGYCYMWDESIAKRGASEVASCIYSHINDHCKDCSVLSLFADNCPGQNKNRL